MTGRFGRAKRSPCRLAEAFTETLEGRRLLDGLTGQYFNRVDFTEPVTTRTDPSIDFTWPASPAAGVKADHFSVRWTGQVQTQVSETYTFTTTADDGVRLWVDGRLLVDNWVNTGPTDRSGSVALEAGKRYDIRMDYYDFDLSGRARLQWSSASTPTQTVPSTNLFASPSGLAATYFDNADFTKPVLKRTDANVAFVWPYGTPDATVEVGAFSTRWTGYVVPDFTQTYTFSVTTVASPSTVQLTVDGKSLVDSGSVQDDGRIQMEAGKRYAIVLQYASLSGGAGVSLQWSSPSRPLQAIPSDHLFTAAQNSIPLRRVTYTNPTLDIDAPDPGIIFADNAYWMTHTTGGPNTGWPLWKSPDGVHWTYQKDLLTTANKQSWMNGNYWAPEIHKVGTNFVLTGVSTDSRTGRLTIVLASSSTIDGTYTVRSEPIVSDSVAVLDSNIFQDDDGKQYLLWKRDGPTGGTHGSIRIRQLDSTGLNFAAGSTETVILDNENGGWEKFLAEAPELMRRGDAYYLFYSGAFIDTTYSVGVARNTNLTSMFTRNPANPIISNNSTWGGPGHGDFTLDADGNVWWLYHAHHQNNVNYGRVQVLDPVVWTTSGWPSFAGNSVSTTAQPGPRVQAISGAGVLTYAGDAGGTATNDTFRLVRSGVGNAMLDVYVNGLLVSSTPYAEVQSITIDAKDGDDVLQMDDSNGDVVPGSGLTFAGGNGNDNVRLTALNGTIDTYRYLGAGQIALGSGLFSSSGVEKLTITGGDHHVKADLTSATTLEVFGGKVTFDVNQKLAGLTVYPAVTVALAVGNHTLTTTKLTVFSSSTLDITDGALVVDYATTDPTPLASIESLLRTGRGTAGDWSGTTGIISSVAAANQANGATLGSGEMTDLYTGTLAIFAGAIVDRTSVLVRYTVDGDANLDRTVDFTDLLTLAKNYGQTEKSFTGGNFDYSNDGAVGFDDLLRLAKRYGQTIALTPAPAVFAETLIAASAVTTSSTRTRKSLATDVVS